MRVAVLAEKGGVGKTMLATNMAGMRAGLRRRVLLLEADRQGGAHHWVSERGRLNGRTPRVTCEPHYGAAFTRYAGRGMVERRYDDIVVDLGLGYSEEMDAALSVVDLALVPVRPSTVDLRTMGLVNRRVGLARENNPGLRAVAVLNAVSTNPRNRDAVVTREILAESCGNLAVADVQVHDRVAYRHAYSYGQTLLEYAVGRSQRKAVGEMLGLYAEIFTEPYECAADRENTAEVSR